MTNKIPDPETFLSKRDVGSLGAGATDWQLMHQGSPLTALTTREACVAEAERLGLQLFDTYWDVALGGWVAGVRVEPGVYRLTRDVTNPKPDRRATRDWRCPVVVEAGSRFLVEDYNIGHMADLGRDLYRTRVKMLGRYGDITNDSPLFAPLVEAFEREPETIGSLFATWEGYTGVALAVLGALIDDGKLTIADVRGALDKVGELWNDEGATREHDERHGL